MAIPPTSPCRLFSSVNSYNNPCNQNVLNPSSCGNIPFSFGFPCSKPSTGVHPTRSFSNCSTPVLEDSCTELDQKVAECSVPSPVWDFPNPDNDLGREWKGRMKDQLEIKPDKLKLGSLVRYLMKEKKWGSILALLYQLRECDVFPDGATCSRLVTSCTQDRKFKVVNILLEVLASDKEVAVMAFEAAIRGFNKFHMYRCTVKIHQRMISMGVGLGPGSYYGIMEAYMGVGDFEKVLELFREYEIMQFGISAVSDKVYVIVFEALRRSSKASVALEYLKDMKRKKISVNGSIYASLISSLASERRISVVEELLEEAKSEEKMPRNTEMFLKVVVMYIQQGRIGKAFSIIDMMENANLRIPDYVFCAIINGVARKRGFRAAVKAFEDLCDRGYKPGQVTYASAINTLCRVGLYSKAEMLFAEMQKKGYDKCVVAYSTMISMYGKAGRLNDAMRLMAKMKSKGCTPNVWIYNSLMEMHGRAKNLRKVEKLWMEMKRKKIAPDKVSYTSLISAHSKVGEFDTCVEYYREFRENGGSIDRVMGGIMVGVLSKSNRVDELVKLLQDMNSEGVVLDGRLFGSARNALRDAGLQSHVNWLDESFVIA